MAEYGLPTNAAINYGALGFPPWVDDLCREWGIDSSTDPNHQIGQRRDIGAAPNPQNLNRGIDWAGDADVLLRFAKWLVSVAPPRTSGVYGPPGVEMVIYQHPRTGERVWYPSWVDYGADFSGHRDHVHTRFSAPPVVEAKPKVVMTVPIEPRANGFWRSPNAAWDHLIMRESGGNPTIIQQIHDVNSGGNEAEGLFQITPRTWKGAGGTEFAPSARLATPQQQAIVAARIFQRNPSGSDWGAGLPGREDAKQLAAGLVPITPPQQEDDEFMSALTPDEQRALYDEIMRPRFSKSPLRHVGEGTIGNIETLEENTDGSVHVLVMWLLAAYLNSPDHLSLLHEVADNSEPNRQWDAKLAQAMLNKIEQMQSSIGCPVFTQCPVAQGQTAPQQAQPVTLPSPSAPEPTTPLAEVHGAHEAPETPHGLQAELTALRAQVQSLHDSLQEFIK